MKQFSILMQKEWRENIRNYKIYWVPAIFILLGITEPVVNFFLPQILQSSGGLPEGAVFEFPTPPPEQILAAVMEQFQTIGMAVLILAYMGTVAGERKSGTATLLYVRPLSFPAYFLSKWVVASAISLVSVWVGFLAGYYYTLLFFDRVEGMELFQMVGTYSIWVLLIVSIIVAASAAMPNGGLAAAVAFAIYLILQLTDGLFGAAWSISPVKLPQYAAAWLADSPDSGSLTGAIGIAALIILALLVFGSWISWKNKAKTKV
ncbi:ABC-2 type transport system permease protein [Planomicrobium stackebrandtii]|uniref:ABC-2 type transport system permease protein n=1 Tax=Planomicrobium stackebrandtii TaxID=253160 RepID=A0ABU0GRN9_9BACL|nr:ABC transporter permease subunit [Planomicrobium stackebrandtii]MDQ0428024.1 ABC-2 type transport system permease protein [Planomicrobium stackebrandtii]